jgi:hypothetical protein
MSGASVVPLLFSAGLTMIMHTLKFCVVLLARGYDLYNAVRGFQVLALACSFTKSRWVF